uniref:Uncharacterized protein n=1 Tax=Setaria italica TaxID=4555 RepID=K3Z1T9_SETIT
MISGQQTLINITGAALKYKSKILVNQELTFLYNYLMSKYNV